MAGDDDLRAVFELLDKASAPAEDIVKALRHVNAAAKSTDGGAKATKGIADSMKSATGAAAPYASALKTIASFAIGMEIAVLSGAAALFKFAAEAAEGQKKTNAAFGVVASAGEDVGALVDEIHGLGNAAGKSYDKVEELFISLRGVGFATREAQDVMAAGFDVGAVFGDQAGGALIESLKKIKATGKFEGRELKPILTQANLPLAEIQKTLATMKGSTVEAIDAAMEAGQISASDGTMAILETTRRLMSKGGPLGSAAKDLGGDTLSGQIQGFKNKFGELFETVDTKPLIAALKTIGDVVSSPAMKAAVSFLEEEFAAVAKSLEKWATPENLTKLIDTILAIVKAVVAMTKAFGEGVGEGAMVLFKPIIDLVTQLGGGGADGLMSFAEVMKVLGQVIGFVAAAIAIGVGVIVFAIYGLVKGTQAAAGFIADHWNVIKWVILGALAPILVPIGIIAAAVLALISPFIAVGYVLYKWGGDVVTAVVGAAQWLWAGVVTIGTAIADFFTGVWETLSSWVDDFVGIFSDIWQTLSDVGSNIVDGLWQGIKDAWATMIKAVSGLVDLLPAAVKKVLGIASPSRVMMDLGMYTMQGFALGITNEAANTNGAMLDAVSTPEPSTTAARMSRERGSGSGGIVININVQVVAGSGVSSEEAERQGAAIGRGIRGELGDVLEQVAIAVGA